MHLKRKEQEYDASLQIKLVCPDVQVQLINHFVILCKITDTLTFVQPHVAAFLTHFYKKKKKISHSMD